MPNENNDKKEKISAIINSKLNRLNLTDEDRLNLTDEDRLLINGLVGAYYRKRIGVSNSAPDTMAAAFLWVYSKSNFLWEGNKKWSLQGIAELFGVNPRTAGDVTSKIMMTLKIKYWDERFCRQDVMKHSPFDKFVMTKSGFIVSREMLGLPSEYPKKREKTKEDYFDEAMNCLEEDEEKRAIELLNTALSIDGEYIEAISELGLIYFDKNTMISKEYYEKAVALSKKKLGGAWPGQLEWGILENRPYLRVIQGLALVFWKNNEIVRAKELFSLLLKLNPNDNQGIRYCMAATYRGLAWEQFGKIEDACAENGNYRELDNMLKEENKTFNFWRVPNNNEQ